MEGLDQDFASSFGYASLAVVEDFLAEAELLGGDFEKLVVAEPR